MEFGINNKLKVVWLCHFSNIKITKLLGVPNKVPEFAPWIPIGIEEAKKRDDIELYVISPNRWLKYSKRFSEGNIHYYFFNSGIPLYGRHWPNVFRFDTMTNFFFNRLKIKKVVSQIKPDIIHLHGAENAYYSSAILDMKNYPNLISIQGFISLLFPNKQPNKIISKNVYFEKRILSEMKNFGVRTMEMKNDVSLFNNKANFFWHEYFVNYKNGIIGGEIEKKYDVVFFAKLSKVKGIEDLIRAIGVLNKKNSDIKLAVIGSTNIDYFSEITKIVSDNDCKKNIDFLGFLPSQKEVHSIVLQSKICCLPSHQETISGTIVESMFLGIPLICGNTGGIPEINSERENVVMIKSGDINELAEKIYFLLNNKSYRDELARNAYDYASKRWDNANSLSDIIKAYKKIISDKL